MPKNHPIQSGDGVSSLSDVYRTTPQRIWEHPPNQHLHATRTDANVLAPDDPFEIPDPRPGEASCVVDRRHRFVLKPRKVMLQLQLLRDGKPRKAAPYTLQIGDLRINGKTNDKGLLEADVPSSTTTAILEVRQFDRPERYTLQIGSLRPLVASTDVEALQQRLSNLGFACDESGILDDETTTAISEFQNWAGLNIEDDDDGQPTDGTLKRLRELHNSLATLADSDK